jgi:hypothetical protein
MWPFKPKPKPLSPPPCQHAWKLVEALGNFIRCCPKCGAMQTSPIPFERLTDGSPDQK